ncbi:MAG: hypothetical protein JWO82_3119 [Akkermansiaceae bacterium]|nr:hypothetical protein [Akkermansiaceae bacterium]
MRALSILFVLALPLAAAAPPDPATMAIGKTAFAVCTACHGMDGKGTPAGPSLMAPPLAKSPIVTGDPAVLALAVLKGIAKENNGTYLAAMAPMAAAISDDAKLAALLTYLRNSFDNSAPAVNAAEAAQYRTQWQDEKGPVTRTRLKELSDQAATRDAKK